MSLFRVLDVQPNAANQESDRRERLRRRVYEILEYSQPGDRTSAIVDGVLIVLISLSVIAVVLESVDSLYQRYSGIFFWLEIVTVAVFSVEYGLRVWCSVEGRGDEAGPADALSVRLKHMVSPAALIDLFAVLPFYMMLSGLGGPADMRFLRIVRLLRVLKLTRYSAAFDTLMEVCRSNARSLAAAFFLLIVVMLIAATGMYFFERDAQPVAFANIPSSMWWAFSTLTTVGYGDVTPITAAGKLFGAMITVVGVGMVALPTGILASAYTNQYRINTDEYRRHSDKAFEDGILTPQEEEELEQLRQTLGIGKSTANRILDADESRARMRMRLSEGCCPHCGKK